MATVTFKGNPVETIGSLPAKGTAAPSFTLVKKDLSEVSLGDYAGQRLILNIFPSVDTPVCATSVRQFNERAGKLDNTTVLCISADLPFAQGRFCGADGITNVTTASTFRSPAFGRDYGVQFTSGPLQGLLSRAVVVVGADGKVQYVQQVPETTNEPDYDAALAALG